MKNNKKTYPRGLFSLALVNTGNIIALATVNALIVLYCTQYLNISVKSSYAIYAAFGSIYYSASLLGGYLGGKYDYFVTFIIGTVITAVGMAILSFGCKVTLFFGLASIIVGCGYIVPNLYCMIGKLYTGEDPSRESGFTVVYITANAAGMLIAFFLGYVVRSYGYHDAFLLSMVFVALTLVIFLLAYSKLKFVPDTDGTIYKAKINFRNIFSVLVTAFIAIPIFFFMINHADVSNCLLVILGVFIVGVIISLALKEHGDTRKKMFIFLIFLILGMTFWTLYMMAPSAIIIFLHNNVNRRIGDTIIPAASIYGVSPGAIIVIGLAYNYILMMLAKRNKTFSLPGKFAVGIMSAGFGYLVLFIGIWFASGNGYTALFWVILSYFLQSLGELLIGPTSFSMVGTLCPDHLEGLMMGALRLSIGVSGAASGFLAAATAAPKGETNPLLTNHIFSHLFGLYGSVTLAVGTAAFILVPKLKKLWH